MKNLAPKKPKVIPHMIETTRIHASAEILVLTIRASSQELTFYLGKLAPKKLKSTKTPGVIVKHLKRTPF